MAILAHQILNPVKLSSWHELEKLAGLLPGWVFRGQRRSSWPLASTLERRSAIASSNINDVEKELLAAFRTSPPPGLSTLPVDYDVMSWFALMQHYGEPTRLVDFTESFQIATFFALHDPAVDGADDEDAAIWAVNTYIIRRMIEQQLKLPLPQPFRFGNDRVGGELLNLIYGRMRISGRGAAVARPAVLNSRLSAQKGLFVYALNLEHSLEENLYSIFSLPAADAQKHVSFGFWNGITAPHIVRKLQTSPVVKILLPRGCHDECRHHLMRAGVCRKTLFPNESAPAA